MRSRFGIVSLLLVLTAVACNIGGINSQAEGLQETIQAGAATAVEETLSAGIIETAPTENPSTGPPSQTAIDEESLTIEDHSWTLVTVPFQEESDDPKYEIDVNSPRLDGESQTAIDFNRDVEAIIQQEIDAFKQAAAENEDFRSENMPEMSSTLFVDYQEKFFDHNLASLLVRFDFYIAGAAHPNLYHVVINYDLAANQPLSLSNLFVDGSPYLEEISAYCVDELEDRELFFFEEGAGPTVENYNNWNITPDHLLITFDPYQVAPYAAGPQHIEVPYGTLQDLMDPDGPLGRLWN